MAQSLAAAAAYDRAQTAAEVHDDFLMYQEFLAFKRRSEAAQAYGGYLGGEEGSGPDSYGYEEPYDGYGEDEEGGALIDLPPT